MNHELIWIVFLILVLTPLFECLNAQNTDQENMFKQWDAYIRNGEKGNSLTLEKIDDSGSAFVLQAKGNGESDAVQLARQAVQAASRFFDAAPRITGGVQAKNKAEAHLFFSAAIGDQKYSGIAMTAGHQKQSEQIVTLFCDAAPQFNQSFQKMMQQQFQTASSPINAAVNPDQLNWQWHRSGTERIKLPDAWQITGSGEGTIQGRGPHGQFVLGFQGIVRYPNVFDAMMPNQTMLAHADYHPPLTAYPQVFPLVAEAIARYNGAPDPDIDIQVLDYTTIPGGYGREAAFLHCITTTNGKISEELVKVITSPAGGQNAWMLYLSGVAADRGELQQNLPVLAEIWNSWASDPEVFRKRINQAMRDMKIATQTMQAAIKARNESMEHACLEWDQYIRGYGQILDTRNDKIFDVNLHDRSDVVDALNEMAGEEAFRVVDVGEW